MNIIEMEDMVKGLPDQVLMQEAQAPSGRIPQFLALSEVQRRKDMRDRFQQQAPQQTVKDMILQGGTAGQPSPQPPQIPGGTQPGGAPPQPVMAYGGGRMPNMYADGGSISAGQQGEMVRQASSGKARLQDFLRQNLTTPQGLGRLAAGALGTAVGGPLAGYAASQGFNRLFPMGPSALEKSVQNVQAANNPFGMYGQSFSDAGAARQAELDQAGAMALGNRYEGYLNRMTNPFAGTGSGIVRDERLGDDSLNMGLGAFTGMAGGGHVPGTVFMQAGGNLEQYTGAYGRLQGTPDIRLLVEQGSPDQIKTAFAESIQAGDDQTASLIQRMAVGRGKVDQGELLDIGKQLRLLRGQEQSQLRASERAAASEQEKLAQQNRANYLLTGQQPPAAAPPVAATAPPADAPSAAPADGAAPGVAPPPQGQNIDMLGTFQQIAAGIRGAGTGSSGVPTEAAMKPFMDFFAVDPNNPALQATDLSPLIAQQEARGKERAAAYEQSIKRIEEEMKRERLGAVLTTLGSSLMAGEGAIGLEKAGTIAQQIGKEMRQEVGAERRAAKASEDATADRIFSLNAQQLTEDKAAQRAIFSAQQGVKEKAFNAFNDKFKNEAQANQAANQLAATLTVGLVNSMRDKIVTEGANARAVLDFAKEQARGLRDTLGTQTIGMKPEDIQKIVEETLRSAIITGYAAIGQPPPAGFEAQLKSIASASSKGTTSGQTSGRFAVSNVSGP